MERQEEAGGGGERSEHHSAGADAWEWSGVRALSEFLRLTHVELSQEGTARSRAKHPSGY